MLADLFFYNTKIFWFNIHLTIKVVEIFLIYMLLKVKAIIRDVYMIYMMD